MSLRRGSSDTVVELQPVSTMIPFFVYTQQAAAMAMIAIIGNDYNSLSHWAPAIMAMSSTHHYHWAPVSHEAWSLNCIVKVFLILYRVPVRSKN